jgi:hypothetical protein
MAMPKIISDEMKIIKDDYGLDLAYELIAIGAHVGSSDYVDIHDNYRTEGTHDKKIDYLYVDRSSGQAWIIQAYVSEDWEKPNPKLNKVSDLSNALTHAFETDLANLHEDVRDPIRDLRQDILDGIIHTVEVCFLHNLKHNKDVDAELDSIEKQLQLHLGNIQPDTSQSLAYSANQISIDKVETFLTGRYNFLAIKDEVVLTASAPVQSVDAEKWQAISYPIKASELVTISAQYGNDLYSPNIRDFLGTRRSSRNINKSIEDTATHQPENFWVFNNGVTGICQMFTHKGKKITATGIGIINGAQTIGTLVAAANQGVIDPEKVLIPMRLIQADDRDLLMSIIRNNNTQNPIKPWEQRVNDPAQLRLNGLFKKEYGLTYRHRRSTERWSSHDIHVDKLGPWVSAFYGDPTGAHRQARLIFEDDSRYSSIFSSSSQITNLLFVYRLGEAVFAKKQHLKSTLPTDGSVTPESRQYTYFQWGAFPTALIYIAA